MAKKRKKKTKKRKKKAKKNTSKPVGRPKTKFTKEQIDYIADCAFHGCQTRTIATLTGIAETTLRSNFGGLLEKKRAERKLELRKSQDLEAGKGNSALLIFLGKNELDQSDKKEYSGSLFVEHKIINFSDANKKK